MKKNDNVILSILRRGLSSKPSHFSKEHMIKKYAKKHSCTALIETGTYKCDMIVATRKRFEYIASVEVMEPLYLEAQKKVQKYTNVHLYLGDSQKRLGTMIAECMQTNLDYKIIFWLDGHYSGGVTGKGEKDTPIVEEIEEIYKSGIASFVLCIDDARCFTHEGEFIDYPTLEYFLKIIKEKWITAICKVENDAIVVVVE